MQEMRSSFRPIAIGFLIVGVVLLVYWQVGSFPFVHYDDNDYVTGNPQVLSGLTWAGASWAFTTTHVANWHPLTWLSHMADVEVFGASPGWHHRVNAGFHASNALLLFWVMFRMTGALWRSGFVAALFAVHPLHVESVAWVSERKDVLSTLFWLLSMWGYLRYAERPGVWRYAMVMLCLSLGLLSKPMVVTLPFVLLLLDVWPLERFGGLRVSPGPPRCPPVPAGRLVLEKVPLLLLSAGSCVATYLAQQSGGALHNTYPFAVRASNAAVSYLSYLGKTLWPSSLSVFYPHPASLGLGIAWWKVAGSLLVLVAVSAGAVLQRRRPYLGVGWLWYLGTLVPVIGLVQVGGQAMADRYTYVPLIGVFVMVSWGAEELLRGIRGGRGILWGTGTAVVAALAVASFVQVSYWRTSETLFSHALEVTENNWMAHFKLGNALLDSKRTKEAVAEYNSVLMTLGYSELYVITLNNIGLALSMEGKYKNATVYLQEALRLMPGYSEARGNLANILFEQGKIEDAITQYRIILRQNPTSGITHNNLGEALMKVGKPVEAERHFQKANQLRPGNLTIMKNIDSARKMKKP